MYIKKYDENGLVTNPITKQSPFINISRKIIKSTQRKSNNRKGYGLVVAKIGPMLFVKYRIQKQVTENGLIVHAHSI